MNTLPDHVRAFIALWPSPAERARLVDEQQRLPASARRVPAENLHATLVFLGPTPIQRLPSLHAMLQTLDIPAGVVELNRLCHWPRASVGVLCAASSAKFEALAGQTAQRATRRTSRWRDR